MVALLRFGIGGRRYINLLNFHVDLCNYNMISLSLTFNLQLWVVVYECREIVHDCYVDEFL